MGQYDPLYLRLDKGSELTHEEGDFNFKFLYDLAMYSATSGTSGGGTSGIPGTSGTSGTSGIGINGTSGTSGQSGTSGTSGIGVAGTSGTSGISGTSGTSGVDGTSGTSGISMPAGGTSGQILSKIDDTDFNVQWIDAPAGSTGTGGVSGTSGTSGLSLNFIGGWLNTDAYGKNDIVQFGTPYRVYIANQNVGIGEDNPSINPKWTLLVMSGTSGTSGDGAGGGSGTSGTSGIDGANGSSGTSGTSGINGTSGTSGLNGSSGTSGTRGTSGSSGTSGLPGTSGTSGTSPSGGLVATDRFTDYSSTTAITAVNPTFQLVKTFDLKAGQLFKIEGYHRGAISTQVNQTRITLTDSSDVDLTDAVYSVLDKHQFSSNTSSYNEMSYNNVVPVQFNNTCGTITTGTVEVGITINYLSPIDQTIKVKVNNSLSGTPWSTNSLMLIYSAY